MVNVVQANDNQVIIGERWIQDPCPRSPDDGVEILHGVPRVITKLYSSFIGYSLQVRCVLLPYQHPYDHFILR